MNESNATETIRLSDVKPGEGIWGKGFAEGQTEVHKLPEVSSDRVVFTLPVWTVALPLCLILVATVLIVRNKHKKTESTS